MRSGRSVTRLYEELCAELQERGWIKTSLGWEHPQIHRHEAMTLASAALSEIEMESRIGQLAKNVTKGETK